MSKTRHHILIGLILWLGLIANTDCLSSERSLNVHWVFAIDTSGSMKLKGQRNLLKAITEKITDEFLDVSKLIIKTGDRITILSFDEEVRLEATSLYQTDNDLATIRTRLNDLNKRSGSLTFISEAVVRATDLVEKYNQFFHTNAVYVFTDGKSEPYSPKWPADRIEKRKERDKENFQKISLISKTQGLNVWFGVLKWEAFDDARSLVARAGKGAHLVDLTDFNRLSLEKALNDFSRSVRSEVKLSPIQKIDLGTIPYKSGDSYQTNISLDMSTIRTAEPPSIVGVIDFYRDNPSQVNGGAQLEIRSTEDKIVLNFALADSDSLSAGTYRGKLKLFPSQAQYGALQIEPSQFDVEFKKIGAVGFFLWRVLAVLLLGSILLIWLVNKIKKKMPLRI